MLISYADLHIYEQLHISKANWRLILLYNNAQNKMQYIKHGESFGIYPLILDFKAPMLSIEVEAAIAKSMVSYMLGLR
jgi:hypothetical protein